MSTDQSLPSGNRAQQRQALRKSGKQGKPLAQRQRTDQDAMAVICPNADCRHEYNLKRHYDRVPAPDKGEDAISWGLRCPRCQHFVHCYYTNPELDRLRDKVQTMLLLYQKRRTPQNFTSYQAAKQLYQVAHEQLNPPKPATQSEAWLARQGDDHGKANMPTPNE